MHSEDDEDSGLICATFTRYQGQPVSIKSGVELEEDGSLCLYFMEEDATNFEGKEQYTVISDSPTSRDFHVLFTTDQFSEALQAYNELKASGCIDIPDELLKHQVGDSIQVAGINDNGKFRYDVDGLTNGNMAILATCLYFLKYQANGHHSQWRPSPYGIPDTAINSCRLVFARCSP